VLLWLPVFFAAPPPPYACKQRAVYLANLAACDIARGDNAEALRACSAAIEEDSTYIKVSIVYCVLCEGWQVVCHLPSREYAQHFFED
jgi:hypothetical protein